ncbi:3'-5' exoribonuclease domain-containing protein [Inquilinus limosus]|uniref:3'-5' exoribonuclease Rv2179c-like domain-containing protein n=1 Tax=Inquilinus limosus MP06 TaxID=1398085 RepID=A0A0A0DD95_9PROT|nr:3'-5' exoribonuclease [Inquilinus limosus]KGM36104.1 hypothetical protein P409_00185 [Inquilinus limosus MP06]
MVDIETTSTEPDRGAIIQIAAWKFDLQTFQVDPLFFDQCLWMPAWRYWNKDTEAFWKKQKPETLQDIFARMEDPRIVMQRFVDWVGQSNSFRFWSKPTHFDYTFLSSYFKDFDLPQMFHYREATDMNSFIRARYYPGPVPQIDIPFDGPVHNALWDSLHQIQTLFAHYSGTLKNDDTAGTGQEAA